MKTTTLIAASVLVLSCSDKSATPPTEIPETEDAQAPNSQVEATSKEAADYFWQAFSGQHHEDAPEATARLQEVYEQAPERPENTLLLAHSYLWQLAEFGRGPAPDPSQIPLLAGSAQRYFAEALALAPQDARIYGWLGPITVGNGQATQMNDLVEQGLELVTAGVEQYPEFNLFVSALVHASAPADSAEFTSAIDALWRNTEVCFGTALDRERPDFAPGIQRTLEGKVDHACTNGPRATHNFEGFFLFFGDLLTKAGDTERALLVYDVAKQGPGYDDWPYQQILLDHEAELDERALLFANDTPEDDPLLVSEEAFNCSYCHAASGE